jgi:WD40 repeat protein
VLCAQIIESYQVSEKNILALAYCQELNWVLAAGSQGFIRIISLERIKHHEEGTEPLPTVLYGHTDAISALAVLKNYVAVSGGHDRQIRFWDLHTMVCIPGNECVMPVLKSWEGAFHPPSFPSS